MVKFEPVLDTSNILKHYTNAIEHFLTVYNGKLLGYIVADEDNLYLFDTGNGMYCTPIILVENCESFDSQFVVITIGDTYNTFNQFDNEIDLDCLLYELTTLDTELAYSQFMHKLSTSTLFEI